jgi:hypothetical protein
LCPIPSFVAQDNVTQCRWAVTTELWQERLKGAEDVKTYFFDNLHDIIEAMQESDEDTEESASSNQPPAASQADEEDLL